MSLVAQKILCKTGPRWSLRNSNTFHRAHRGRPKLYSALKGLLAALVVAHLVTSANGLSSHKAMSEYIRDQWSAEQGFPGGPVYAIAQTPDGYLWIGTEKGLLRFDGVGFQLFSQANSTALLAGPILDLMTDADGNLWIRPQSRNILRYRDGTFQDVMPELDIAHYGVTAMCRGPKGEALFA